jgi:hypothetical protein
MKNKVLMLAVALGALVVAAFFAKEWLSHGRLKTPERPALVPSNATWLGEVWVSCSPEPANPTNYQCVFYDDVHGNRLQSGTFAWKGSGQVPITNDEFTGPAQWDGIEISFDGGALVAVGPQIHLPDSPNQWVETPETKP